MVHHGPAAAVADAAVGCEIAFAGVRGAIWNVLVHLNGIADREFAAEKRRQCEQLLEESKKLLHEAEEKASGIVSEGAP